MNAKNINAMVKGKKTCEDLIDLLTDPQNKYKSRNYVKVGGNLFIQASPCYQPLC